MLRIRLSRFGAKNAPTYRLIVSEHTKDTQGDALEYLGSYDPRQDPKFVQLKQERIEYWISKGAQPSATVHNLLVSEGVIKGKKVHAFRIKKKAGQDAPAEETKSQENPAEGGEAAEAPAEEKATDTPTAEEKPAEPAADEEKKEAAEAPADKEAAS